MKNVLIKNFQKIFQKNFQKKFFKKFSKKFSKIYPSCVTIGDQKLLPLFT